MLKDDGDVSLTLDNKLLWNKGELEATNKLKEALMETLHRKLWVSKSFGISFILEMCIKSLFYNADRSFSHIRRFVLF